MGTYADSLLSAGEQVIRRERQHWLALLLDARAAIGLWIVALLVLAAIILPDIKGTGRDLLSYVVLGALVIGIAIFLFRWWQWRSEEYMVTSRRLLKVSGIINKESGDSSLEKINDAVLFENVLGRMLNYGDLDILTAAEVAVDRYRMLHHAKAFKIDMLNAKHSLEHEVAYVEMPTPPLKTDGPAGGGDVPLPPAASPPDAPPAATTTIPLPAASAAMDTAVVASMASPAVEAASPAPAVIDDDDQEPVPDEHDGSPDEHDGSPEEHDASPEEHDASPEEHDGSPEEHDASPEEHEHVVGASADASATPMPAATEPAPTSAIDTPDEVMQALSRLAGLRDNGTITEEEYESKKQELLARL